MTGAVLGREQASKATPASRPERFTDSADASSGLMCTSAGGRAARGLSQLLGEIGTDCTTSGSTQPMVCVDPSLLGGIECDPCGNVDRNVSPYPVMT